jgi:Zn-finger nucleic acid-binding protein
MAEVGWAWALATGYDIAFLYLVLAALEDAPFETARCTALPFRKLRVRRLSEPHRKWVAAFNILLMAEKCRDDVADEGGWKGKLGLRVLCGQVAKATDTLADSGFPVELLRGLSTRQAELERQEGLSLEHLGQPTSELLGEAFAHLAKLTHQGEREFALRHLGQGLGAAIYFKDAAEDFEKDEKLGSFNALAECVGQIDLQGVLAREHRRCQSGLKSLGLSARDRKLGESILENLLPATPETEDSEVPRAARMHPLRPRRWMRGTCDCGGCDCGGCDGGCGDCGGCDACCDPSCASSCGDCGGCNCPCDGCTCDGCGSSTAGSSSKAPAEAVPPPPLAPRLHCPACGHDLMAATHSGVEIDECAKCLGIWLDHGELEALAEMDNLPRRLLSARIPGNISLRPDGTRPCPRCARFLVGTTVKGVRLDLCSDCQGVWLDQGELNQILER